MLQNLRQNTVSVLELQSHDNKKGDVLYVDVRERAEWDQGHIAWFKNVPLAEIYYYFSEWKQYRQIYFICRSGGRSGQACDIAERAGLKNTFSIKGGMIAWEKEGYPIVR